jgi:hypothetical protein
MEKTSKRTLLTQADQEMKLIPWVFHVNRDARLGGVAVKTLEQREETWAPRKF